MQTPALRLRLLFVPVLLFLCLLVALPATGQQIRIAEDLGGELRLWLGDNAYLLKTADGRQVDLPFSERAWISDFVGGGESWYATAVEGRGDFYEIAVVAGREVSWEELPSPKIEDPTLLLSPMVFTDRSGLLGMAWLEGGDHDRLAVRAARFDGKEWEASQTVSPPGPGSQLALSATVLRDGSWLLAWSAVDGEDDEILWSRFDGSAWSEPAPVHEDNKVPDVTPRLLSTAGGALVAWSRYDGNDYRVTMARFTGNGWTEPKLTGPAGSIEPFFQKVDGRTLVIYRKAVPRGWSVMETDDSGQALRNAHLKSLARQRPLVGAVSEKGVRFEWPGVVEKADAPLTPWAAEK